MTPVTSFAGKTVAVFGLGGSGFVSAQALTHVQPHPRSQAIDAVATRSSNSAIDARPGSA